MGPVRKRPPPKPETKVLLRPCQVQVIRKVREEWINIHPDNAWWEAARQMKRPDVTGVAVHPEVWGVI